MGTAEGAAPEMGHKTVKGANSRLDRPLKSRAGQPYDVGQTN